MQGRMGVNLTLVFVALLWGVGFVPQRAAMDYMDPAAFTALRFLLGALTLAPLLLYQGLYRKASVRKSMLSRSTLALGCMLGILLFGGALLQQIAIQYTTVANVAFITGLYVILVPVLGYFLGLRYRPVVWFGGALAVMGLYLMTGSSSQLSLKGDVLALLGAVFWAVHLLLIARKAAGHYELGLAFYQFLVCGLLSAAFALTFETRIVPSAAMGYVWSALNGVFVVGLAYTLQVLVLKHAEPFVAAIIFSLEAVFGALAAFLVFAEIPTAVALGGAALMLLGCLLAQAPRSEKSPTSAP